MTADAPPQPQPQPEPEPDRADEPAADADRSPHAPAGDASSLGATVRIPLTLGRGRAPARVAVVCEEGYPRTEAQVRALVEFALPTLEEIRVRRGFTPTAGFWTVGLVPAHVPWRTHLSAAVAARVAADLATRPAGTAVVIVALIDPITPHLDPAAN
jgi:hypothetical protein